MSGVFKGLTILLSLTVAQSAAVPALHRPALAAEVMRGAAQDSTSPTLTQLESALGERIVRVPEFQFIREEASRLGVRAWLFGGTAAGFGHYVKWDLLREKGDPRFQPDRFDYDYTNIYRSTQDLDIVIDGPPEKAQQLQSLLAKNYPHLQGSKSAWEVRLLREDMGEKQALLFNPDFLNQHTDSNSTGMIELTPPPRGEPVARDLRDWNAHAPHFLKDLHEGSLHYYFSPSHEATKFAREGRNPPILSAIRYLTKAFQYELKLRPEDLAQIKQVIAQYDPGAKVSNYVSEWIEWNGRKLIQNAVNIEYAVKTLDELGLRSKLRARGDPREVDSLAWWMNKEPLRTEPLGTTGRTAREIFEQKGWSKPGGPLVVAHETRNFLAYESITRAHTGDPNVLTSRDGAVGEAAVHGNGFYTRVGREGARGTGLTIRFTLAPEAREGTDFVLGKDDAQEYVILRNKRAIRVIPESLNLGVVEYFEMLAQHHQFASSDRGILEKLKRRLQARAAAVTPEEAEKILAIVKASPPGSELHKEWFSLPVSTRYPDEMRVFLRTTDNGWNFGLIQHMASQRHWADNTPFMQTAIGLNHYKVDSAIVEAFLRSPVWPGHSLGCGMLLRLLERLEARSRFALNPGLAPWHESPCAPRILEAFKDHHSTSEMIKLLARNGWTERPEVPAILGKIVEESDHYHPEIASQVLVHPYWAKRPEGIRMFRTILERLDPSDHNTVLRTLEQPLAHEHWIGHPEFPDLFQKIREIKRGNDTFFLMKNPKWGEIPEAMDFLEKAVLDKPALALSAGLRHEGWEKYPRLVQQALDRNDPKIDAVIVEKIISEDHWARAHPEFLRTILGRGIAASRWQSLMSGEARRRYAERAEVDLAIAVFLLAEARWAGRPEGFEALKTLVERGTADEALQKYVLSHPQWQTHPDLLKLTGGEPVTLERVREGLARARGCAGLFSRLLR